MVIKSLPKQKNLYLGPSFALVPTGNKRHIGPVWKYIEQEN